MTIGPANVNRYIVINPGDRAFESRNPGVMYVSISRATTAGSDSQLPDFAFHPHVLLNQDRVCHRPNTPLLRARNLEVRRIENITKSTKDKFPRLQTEAAFLEMIELVHRTSEE
jgi:hypothetical protein